MSLYPYLKWGAIVAKQLNSLKRVHSVSYHTRFMELRFQFQTMIKKWSINWWLCSSFENCVDHLAAIGKAVTNSDLILHVITCFDSTYNHFVSYFMVHLDASLFDEFHSQLLTYERRLE